MKNEEKKPSKTAPKPSEKKESEKSAEDIFVNCTVIAASFKKGAMNCAKGAKIKLLQKEADFAESKGFVKITGVA